MFLLQTFLCLYWCFTIIFGVIAIFGQMLLLFHIIDTIVTTPFLFGVIAISPIIYLLYSLSRPSLPSLTNNVTSRSTQKNYVFQHLAKDVNASACARRASGFDISATKRSANTFCICSGRLASAFRIFPATFESRFV